MIGNINFHEPKIKLNMYCIKKLLDIPVVSFVDL